MGLLDDYFCCRVCDEELPVQYLELGGVGNEELCRSCAHETGERDYDAGEWD